MAYVKKFPDGQYWVYVAYVKVTNLRKESLCYGLVPSHKQDEDEEDEEEESMKGKWVVYFDEPSNTCEVDDNQTLLLLIGDC